MVYSGHVYEEEMVGGVGEGIRGLSSALNGLGPISHNTKKKKYWGKIFILEWREGHFSVIHLFFSF